MRSGRTVARWRTAAKPVATVTKTWTFTSDAEGLADVGDSAITFAKDAGDPSVHFTGAASGTQERGRRASTGETWETWGVPAGATVTSVQVLSWQSRRWAAPASQTPTISMRVLDSAAASVHAAGDLVSTNLGTGTDTGWVNQGAGTSRNVDSGKQASNTDVRLEIELDVSLASSTWDVGVDTIALQITYSGGPPTWVASSTGATDAGGAWSFTCSAPGAAGRVIIVQIYQDGNTNGAVTVTGATNIENLAGTDNAWTQIPGTNADGSWLVGQTSVGRHFIYIGRSLSTSAPTISGGNSTSEDLYIIAHEFQDVNTGTTLADVIENSSAGNAVNFASDNTITIQDSGVTTLGKNRLALNLIAMEDDETNFATVFSGQSGGTWVLRGSFGSSSGTDGAVILQTATMASAGTINGGSYEVGAQTWYSTVGFALIGNSPYLDQTHFRFRNDDGSESTATWKENLDTNTNIAQGGQFRIRFGVEEENGGGDPPSQAYRMAYSKNGGAWTMIGGSGLDDPIRAFNSTNVADGTATTQQITSGSFTAGLYEDLAAQTPALDLPKQAITEFEWSVELHAGASSPFAVNDVVQLRIEISGGTALNAYSNIAQFTVVSGVVVYVPRYGNVNFQDPGVV